MYFQTTPVPMRRLCTIMICLCSPTLLQQPLISVPELLKWYTYLTSYILHQGFNTLRDAESYEVNSILRRVISGSWGTMLQAGRSRVRLPMRSLDYLNHWILNLPNHSSRTMTLGSTQPLTEMSNTRTIFLGLEG
jgi:hypothetical protein